MLKDMLERRPNSVIIVCFLIALAFSNVTRAQAPDASYMAGYASFINGNLPQALEHFTLAIARNNSDDQLFVYRGRVSLQLRDYENAIRDFSEANEIVPGVSDIWLARTYALSGNQDKALSFLKSHLTSVYRLPEDSIKKDPAFDALQTSQGWFSLWDKDWYSDEEKAGVEVAYNLRKGHPEKAISLLDAEIGKSPSSAELLTLRGEVNFTSGNNASAIADYTTALELSKNSEKGKYLPLEGLLAGSGRMGEGGRYALRGEAYLKASRFKDAVNDFTRALKENPAFFTGYLLRAQAYTGLKSNDAAIRDVQTYLKYFDNNQQAIFQCGEYYFQAEDYMNALKCFNKNLKEDPNNGLYYKARGKTYLKTDTYRYAVYDLSMSLDLNPGDAETWMYLGLAKIQSGDKENGCSDLDKARQMGNTEVLKYIVDNCR
jgi:tetratricopeptide (TPR) repeat protein